jgi:hypothetical protein
MDGGHKKTRLSTGVFFIYKPERLSPCLAGFPYKAILPFGCPFEHTAIHPFTLRGGGVSDEIRKRGRFHDGGRFLQHVSTLIQSEHPLKVRASVFLGNIIVNSLHVGFVKPVGAISVLQQ